MLHIVLVEPEIPQNTGNISRTCAVTGAALHLVGPLGFQIDDRQLRRAGLDYWHTLTLYRHDAFEDVEHMFPHGRFFLCSTHGGRSYADARYADGDILVFGKETAGLPKELLLRREADVVRIPMREGQRSLNLSNAVAVVAYEALRQMGFPAMR